MIVEEVGQMVGNQVLAGDPEINWIPELKLSSHFAQFLFGNAAFGREFRVLKKDVIPDFIRHLFWLNPQFVVAVVSTEGLALQEVGDCVVRHVDGGIRQRFNQPLFIPKGKNNVLICSDLYLLETLNVSQK